MPHQSIRKQKLDLEKLKAQSSIGHANDQAQYMREQAQHMRNQDRRDALKMNEDREQNRTKNLGDTLTRGADLAEKRYKNQAALPSQHENDAQLFSDIAKNFIGKRGRPEGAAGYLAHGISKGLEYGARSKAISEKKENFDKYDRVMDYLEQNNNALIEQNNWYQKRDFAKQKLMPQIMAYMNNINTLDAQSRRLMAQDILTQYGDAIGENFRLLSIDGTNPSLMTIQSDKGQQLFDLRSVLDNDPMARQLVADKMPEFLIGLQDQRANAQEQMSGSPKGNSPLQTNEMPKQNNIMEVQGNQTLPPDNGNDMPIENGGKFQGYGTIDLDMLQPSAEAKYQNSVQDNLKNITFNQRNIKIIDKMSEIFGKDPDIWKSYIRMLDNGDENEGWISWGKKVITDQDELAKIKILAKYTSDLNLGKIMGVSSKVATDRLKQMIREAAPSGTLPKKAFDEISSSWKEQAQESINFALKQAEGLNEGVMIYPLSGNHDFSQPSNNNQTTNNNQSSAYDEWNIVGRHGVGRHG